MPVVFASRKGEPVRPWTQTTTCADCKSGCQVDVRQFGRLLDNEAVALCVECYAKCEAHVIPSASVRGPELVVHGMCKRSSPDCPEKDLQDCEAHMRGDLAPMLRLITAVEHYLDNPGCNLPAQQTAKARLRWAVESAALVAKLKSKLLPDDSRPIEQPPT